MNNKGNQGYNNDNSWGGQNVRKSYDYYNQNNRGDYHHQQQQHHEGGNNKIEQRMQNLRLDNGSSGNKGSNAAEHKEPKKMTWATIASQPAKPQINTTSTTIKKKGPGMPPPPMVPGKHNMELNDGWDTPKNGPLVPPSPPIITAPPIDLSSLNKQNSSFDGEPAWPTPGQAVSQLPKDQQQQQQNSQNFNNNNNNTNNNSQPPHNNNNTNNNKYDKYDKYDKYEKYDKPDKYDKYENSNQQQRGYQMNNNYQNNYHGRQYNQNNSGPNQHYNSSSNYNDYQKPYHQHPHQMPTAPTQKYEKYEQSSAPITRAIQQPPQPSQPPQQQQSAPSSGSDYNSLDTTDENVLDQLRVKNQYNPSELDLSLVDNARFFVIKSYSEDDIHRSIKYEIWCSTEHGNKRLDQAFREREKENGVIYLFFSVNSSGHFCGVAQMMSSVDYNTNSSVWSQDKWKGSFRVKWVYVKDVPNTQLRHIRLENNENKPVTNSRDTQEVPNLHGIQILKIIHSYKHTTSIFDDFTHYEKRQEEEDSRKHDNDGGYQKPMTLPASHHSTHNRENSNRQQYDNGRSYDRDYNGGGGSGGFDRGNYNNGNSFNKYNSGYNNDFKPFNNGRGNYHNKRNDFRNDRNDRNGGDQPSGIYRSKDYQQNDDYGNRGGYRSDRGGSRGRGSFRSSNYNN